jgi:hypothetical protein
MKIAECLTPAGVKVLQASGSNPEGINQYTGHNKEEADAEYSALDASDKALDASKVANQTGKSEDHATARDLHVKAAAANSKAATLAGKKSENSTGRSTQDLHDWVGFHSKEAAVHAGKI